MAEGVISRLDSPAVAGVTFERVVAVSLDAAVADLQVGALGRGWEGAAALGWWRRRRGLIAGCVWQQLAWLSACFS